LNLEIFDYIDDIIELYDSKRDVYKLIAEEVKEYFENHVFQQSKYTLNLIYRIKSVESIREKLLRSSFISKYNTNEEILANFQDLLGFRIECKFIDDETYVWELLRAVFTETEDGVYYYDPILPKIKLKLSEDQPQKQKNGFDIYKIDGLYMLGKDSVRFELQIKALVNTFWGEIEHRIIYKNNSYLLGDSFVSDLMVSIKKSLNMIDSQLYVLYKRFKRAEGAEFEMNNARAIEQFISKMVYDTFAAMMNEQIGFTIDFKSSCDAVVRYIMEVNNAGDMEDYGRVMLNIFYTLNSFQEDAVRVDTQLEFERQIYYEDVFSANILETVLRLININYKWHLFFLVLFNIERGGNAADLESHICYYRNVILSNRSFALLDQLSSEDANRIRFEMLGAISEVFREKQNIEYLCALGIKTIHRALNYTIPLTVAEIQNGKSWEEIREQSLCVLKDRMSLK